jgi:hypothetical protein
MVRARFNNRSTAAFSKSECLNFHHAAPSGSNLTKLLHFLEAIASSNGELTVKNPLVWMTGTLCLVVLTPVAHARSAYDGAWELAFVTQRGLCDPSYNFTVDISNGIVSHPNLVRFRGYVTKSGSVHASVTVQDKFASGTGKLFGTSGRGKWSGRAGSERCSGYWTAQRN